MTFDKFAVDSVQLRVKLTGHRKEINQEEYSYMGFKQDEALKLPDRLWKGDLDTTDSAM